MISVRFAWREIRNNRKFCVLFALNLALGLLGLICLDTTKAAVDRSLDAKSRLLLSADLSVSARRPLTESEDRDLHALLPADTREGRTIEMYSMVASAKSSRLAEIAAIDDTYPLYGQLALQSSPKPDLRSGSAWMQPDLALQLGVKKGDSVKIGDASFKVGDLIADDTGTVWNGFSPASRMYIGLSHVADTHLIRKGSLVYYSRLFAVPEGTDVTSLARGIDHKLTDPAIQVRTHRDATEEVGRLLNYLTDDLGLVALVALFLAAIGSGYLFRSFLSRRTGEIAILRSVGASRSFTERVYFCKLGMLGALAAPLASIVAALVLPAAGWVASPYLPFPIELHVEARTVVLSFFLGIFGSILICLPLVLKIRDLKPAALFRESASASAGFSVRQLLGAFPGVLVFSVLSIWQAHSFFIGSVFLGAFFGSGALLGGVGLAAFSLLAKVESKADFRIRTAIRYLRRNRLSTLSCFVAIGIGSLLLNLVPSVQKSLEADLIEPAHEDIPGLFLFDIQQEQVEPLKQYLRSEGMSLGHLSPLVRARLLQVNGAPFEKKQSGDRFSTREEEQEARSHNRGFNLSYPLENGEDFDGPYEASSGKPAEVSLERRFAKRMKLKIGDLLDFDVEGVPIQGRVTRLRKIHWTSFQPNFFILFQPGVLDDAPKTFVASLPRLGLDRKIEVQNGVVARFPNVSMFDVADLISKILLIFRQMGWALRIMACVSLATGFVVLLSIAGHQAASRSRETNLLKVLGAQFGDVRFIALCEFTILGFSASALGTMLCYPVSWLITDLLFDETWVFTWKLPLASVVAVTALSLLSAAIATRKTLLQKPALLLSEAEN